MMDLVFLCPRTLSGSVVLACPAHNCLSSLYSVFPQTIHMLEPVCVCVCVREKSSYSRSRFTGTRDNGDSLNRIISGNGFLF